MHHSHTCTWRGWTHTHGSLTHVWFILTPTLTHIFTQYNTHTCIHTQIHSNTPLPHIHPHPHTHTFIQCTPHTDSQAYSTHKLLDMSHTHTTHTKHMPLTQHITCSYTHHTPWHVHCEQTFQNMRRHPENCLSKQESVPVSQRLGKEWFSPLLSRRWNSKQ